MDAVVFVLGAAVGIALGLLVSIAMRPPDGDR